MTYKWNPQNGGSWISEPTVEGREIKKADELAQDITNCEVEIRPKGFDWPIWLYWKKKRG